MLEFEHLCRRLHLLCHLVDESAALVGGHLPAALDLGVHILGLHGDIENVAHVLNNGLRDYAVLLVILHLYATPADGLGYGALHRVRDGVGVHYDSAVCVARGAADRLYHRRFAAQETLFIGVDNDDKRDFGDIEPLAQQVYADEYVKFTHSKVADYLHSLDRVDVVVQIAALDADVFEVVGEILRHFFSKRGYQHALAAVDTGIRFGDDVLDLPLGRADGYFGIQESGRAYKLFGGDAGFLALVVAGRGAHEYDLVDLFLKLREIERTVVVGRRQTEAVVDQVLLSRAVARVHAAHLRHGDVAFVDEH